MDPLFTATIPVNGQPVSFDVHFEQESYVFAPASGGAESLRLRKEHDEWHTEGPADPATRTAAAEALDRYLLSQH
jgi:hypothetical protein